MMDRRITNTTPTTVRDDDDMERTRIQPVTRVPLEQSFHHRPSSSSTTCQKAAIEGGPQLLSVLMSQVGSKRKAPATSPRQKEEQEETTRAIRLTPDIRDHQWFASAPPEAPTLRLNQSTGTDTKGDQESELTFCIHELGYEATSRGKSKLAMDDLDETMYPIPPPPRKYRRRNSFFIHEDSTKHSTILHNIKMASFNEGDNLSDGKSVFGGAQDCGGHRLRRANSLLLEPVTTSSPTAQLDDTNSRMQHWGNATWANSEDTNWYSELSSLSFLDSRPILPAASLAAAVSYSEEAEELSNTRSSSFSTVTSTSAMVPPATRQPLQRNTKDLSKEVLE